MYHVARTLTALSNKGVLIALATTFALFFTLGYFITMWIFYVPLALMGLRFAFIAKTVLGSAMKIGWPQTFEELMKQIQLVQEELAAMEIASELSSSRLVGAECQTRSSTRDALIRKPLYQKGLWTKANPSKRECTYLSEMDKPLGSNPELSIPDPESREFVMSIEDGDNNLVTTPILVMNGDIEESENDKEDGPPKLTLVK